MKKNDRNVYTICMSVVTAIFAIAAMTLLTVGIMEYKNIAFSNLENYELRTSVSYVATKIRQNDVSDMIREDWVEGIHVLRLVEKGGNDVYETVIYHKDGTIYEYYHDIGGQVKPDYGFAVMNVEQFEFELAEDSTIILKARNASGNETTLSLAVRSERN